MEINLLRRVFLPYFFIMSLLLTGAPLLASESRLPSDEYFNHEENVIFPSEEGRTTPLVFQGWDYNNNHEIVSRLDGIGGDDDGLGEVEVPAGDGLLMLIGFSVLFIIFRLRKQLML